MIRRTIEYPGGQPIRKGDDRLIQHLELKVAIGVRCLAEDPFEFVGTVSFAGETLLTTDPVDDPDVAKVAAKRAIEERIVALLSAER